MLLALNGATTMKADLETDVRAAGHAGFDLVEIWAPKLREYLKQHTTEELKKLIASEGLRAYSINSIENITFRVVEKHAELVAECEDLCRTAQEIDCAYLVVVPSPRPDRVSDDDVTSESVRVLRELSSVAEGYGAGIAFEFIGRPDSSVRTLNHCLAIVNHVARPNVGLVIDTFHFYTGKSELESIEKLNPNQLFIFHINGSENRPKDELRDSHRLLPGMGVVPIKEIWSALQGIGYNRMASVEIFRPEYWDWNPMELAVKAKEAARKALGLL